MNDDIKNGQYAAEQLTPLVNLLTSNAENKIHWWAGFLGVLVGYAGADIGHEALDVLGTAFDDVVREELKKESH